ncbi:MAG: hypothetical protein ACYTGQ_08325 [Planctomycetota bacterium]|jgi:hypothetical protein
MSPETQPQSEPNVCVPWSEKKAELPEIQGNEELVKQVWQDNDALAYMYIWHCLVSF